jgi:hypothetical protein
MVVGKLGTVASEYVPESARIPTPGSTKIACRPIVGGDAATWCFPVS